jgi:hypothetical protein
VTLSLPRLQQLSLSGFSQVFVEKAAGWHIPALQSLSINCGNNCRDQPAALAFSPPTWFTLLYVDLIHVHSTLKRTQDPHVSRDARSGVRDGR